jgi:hypothetical protein
MKCEASKVKLREMIDVATSELMTTPNSSGMVYGAG